MATKNSLLQFKFEGPAINDGRILYDDLNIFVSNIRLAIERIINSINTGESIKKGRPSKTTQILSALEIVSMKKGSFTLGLDLRREEKQFPGWDLGEQAVNSLMSGFEAIENQEELPLEYDQGVLIALREAGRIIERGITKVSINSNSREGKKRVTYTLPIRERIIVRLNRNEQSYAVIEGRLLSVDAKEDKLRCRIEPSIGEPTICRFDEELTEQIVQSIRKFVQARGDATYDVSTNKITSFYIKDLELIDESNAGDRTLIQLSPFWQERDFEDFVNEQSVYPVDNIDDLSRDWPEDTDIESFIKAVRGSRSQA